MKRILLFTSVLLLTFAVTTSGQFFAADARLDWWMLDTPHFYIIYHTGLEEVAQEAADLAEFAYDFWERELDYHLEAKTKIVLVDNTDLNGGAANPFAHTIGITPTEARTFNEWLNSRNQNPLDTVVLHEHGHVVDLAKVSGISAQLREVFGTSIMPTLFKPGMFTEGLPIYFEMLRSGDSRANDPREAMYFRQMVLEDEFIPFDQVLSFHPRNEWPSWYMITHNVGPWVMRYMGETYGSDSIERFDRILAEDPLALSPFLTQVFGGLLGVPVPPVVPNFGSVMERATGANGEEFAAGFENWLTEMFDKQIEQIGQSSITESTQISALDFWNNKPSYSPNGEWLAYFHSDPTRGSQIRLVKPNGTSDRPVALNEPGFGFFRPHFWSPIPSWSRDGKSIVYSDIDLEYRYYLRSDIYVHNVETGRTTQLTEGERAYRPIFTPDGESVIYARYEWGGQATDLYIMDLNSGRKRLLRRLPENSLLDSFSLSPDGETLALSLWRWGGYQDIYTLSVGDWRLTPITQDRATDLDPTWSPDGNHILFSSDRDGVNNLYAFDMTNRDFHRVTNVLSGAFHPAISPDGSEITFVGYDSNGYTLEQIPYNTASWQEISTPAHEEIPVKPAVETRYEQQPYDPALTLNPNGFTPLLSTENIGLNLGGLEALFNQFYNVTVGLDFESGQPYYSLLYNSTSHVAPFTWTFNLIGNPQGSRQAITLSYPLVQKLATQETISVELSRAYFGDIASGLSLSWDLGHLSGLDLAKNQLNMHLEGSLSHMRDADVWYKGWAIRIDDELNLPVESDQRIAYHFGYGWSDQPDAYSLGGRRGDFALRGHEAGSISGSNYILSRVEYRFTFNTLNNGVGSFPLLMRDLRARVYADIGTAADDIPWDINAMSAGLGMELQLAFTMNYLMSNALRVGIMADADVLEPQFYFDLGIDF